MSVKRNVRTLIKERRKTFGKSKHDNIPDVVVFFAFLILQRTS